MSNTGNGSNKPNRRPAPKLPPVLKVAAPTAAIPLPGKNKPAPVSNLDKAFARLTDAKKSARTWAKRNEKVSDQDRVIAVKISESRTVHSDCADAVGFAVPTVAAKITEMAVFAYQAPHIAVTGGLTCSDCGKAIVGAVKKTKK
jgi:hypothetical protein